MKDKADHDTNATWRIVTEEDGWRLELAIESNLLFCWHNCYTDDGDFVGGNGVGNCDCGSQLPKPLQLAMKLHSL